MGLVFTPLQVLAFATLAPGLRTEGAALFSLGRNIGAAIGVSVTTSLLAHNAQALHEIIGASVNPFNRALQALGSARYWLDPASHQGAMMLDRIVNHQAQIIAYINDYVLMIFTTMPALLLLLLMRRPRHAPVRRGGAGRTSEVGSSAGGIQRVDVLSVELQLGRLHHVLQLFQAGGAGDRRRDAGPRDQPGQRHLRRRRLVPRRHIVERLQHAEAALVEVLLHPAAARALAQVRLGAVLAGKEPRRQRVVVDHAETFRLAQRLQFRFERGPLDQVVQRLQRFVARQAVLPC